MKMLVCSLYFAGLLKQPSVELLLNFRYNLLMHYRSIFCAEADQSKIDLKQWDCACLKQKILEIRKRFCFLIEHK